MIDKGELERAIEELQMMIREAQRDVGTATIEMHRAEAIVDGIHETLADAELTLSHADCLHSEAYARLDTLCFAIATLRRERDAL